MTGISRSNTQLDEDCKTQVFSVSESLGTISGSNSFNPTQYEINPGSATMFPVLSREAAQWEKYRFRKLEFEYRTSINEFATNAYGRVILGVDYDATDPPPNSQQQAENSRPVGAQVPYVNFRVRCKPADMHDITKWKFVRPGAVPGDADVRLFDVGTLNVCTQGNVNSNTIGELWVHAEGDFKNQVSEALGQPPQNFRIAQFQDNAFTHPVSATPFTLPMPQQVANPLGITNAAGLFTLPVGNYLIRFDALVSASGAISNSNTGLYVGGVLLGPGPSPNAPSFVISTPGTGTNLTYGQSEFVQISNPAQQQVTLIGDTTATGTITHIGTIIFQAV
jgi:hypothetical protein